jgi:hypothetical protein
LTKWIHQAILLQRLGLNLQKTLPLTAYPLCFYRCWEVLERNVVKTFVDITPKSTIYTPNCGTWASPVISQGFDAFIITPVSAWFYDMI